MILAALALSTVLNAQSVNVNDVMALRNLDSVLTECNVVLTDTPTVIIATCDVPMDTLATAFRYARIIMKRGKPNLADFPGYEHAQIVNDRPTEGKKKFYILLHQDDGNLPEIICEVSGELGAIRLTYITNKGTVVAVEKL
jgi:hypothetical protein